MKALAGGLLVTALTAACAEPPPAGPAPLPAFELRSVAAEKLAEYEARVGPLEIPATSDEVAAEAEGLVIFLSSASGPMGDVAFEDVVRLGDAAIAPLAAVLRDQARQADERRAALRLIGELKSPAAVDRLLEEASTNPEPSMRALAAWKLGSMGDDGCIPGLIKRLRYETAPEVEPWLARSLSGFDNFAGVDALSVLASWQGADSEAGMHLAQIASDSGFETPAAEEGAPPVPQVAELIATWHAGDPAGLLPLDPPRSDRWHLAVWRWILGLSDFQLRGVDDGRYILSHLRPEAALEIAAALHDDNRYIRTHVAQALGRMGPRGRAAAPELAAALGDPLLAPYAAEALATVAAATPGFSQPALDFSPRELLDNCSVAGRDPGLRLAAVRALGTLGDRAAVTRLDELTAEASFPELQQAATESLAVLGEGRRVAPALIACARNEDLDATTSMRALRAWIGLEAQAGAAWAEELANAWDALAPSPFVAPTAAENIERQAKRLALVEAAL